MDVRQYGPLPYIRAFTCRLPIFIPALLLWTTLEKMEFWIDEKEDVFWSQNRQRMNIDHFLSCIDSFPKLKLVTVFYILQNTRNILWKQPP